MIPPYQTVGAYDHRGSRTGMCHTRLCYQILERPVLLLQTVPLLITGTDRTLQRPSPPTFQKKAIRPPPDPIRNRLERTSTQTDASKVHRLPNTQRSLRHAPRAGTIEKGTSNNQNTIRLVVQTNHDTNQRARKQKKSRGDDR